MEEALTLIKERIDFCLSIQQRDISQEQKDDYLAQRDWWIELGELLAGAKTEHTYAQLIEKTLEVYVGEQYNRYLRLQEILAIKEGFEERGDEISEEDALMFEKIADSLNTAVDEIEKIQRSKIALDKLMNSNN